VEGLKSLLIYSGGLNLEQYIIEGSI
jgi:hypothetical protein